VGTTNRCYDWRDDECRWGICGVIPWKTEKRNKPKFIKDFRENAFESANMWEFRIDFKSRLFFIETLVFIICVLLARDSVKVSSDTFTWIWNKYLRYTVRYILHRRYRFRSIKKSGYSMCSTVTGI
jgi:hypothetical protein